MPRGKQLSSKTQGRIEALHSVGPSVRQIAALSATLGIWLISACNGFPMAAAIMKTTWTWECNNDPGRSSTEENGTAEPQSTITTALVSAG